MKPGDVVRYRLRPNRHERFGVVVSVGPAYVRVRQGRPDDSPVKRIKRENVRLWKAATEEAE